MFGTAEALQLDLDYLKWIKVIQHSYEDAGYAAILDEECDAIVGFVYDKEWGAWGDSKQQFLHWCWGKARSENKFDATKDGGKTRYRMVSLDDFDTVQSFAELPVIDIEDFTEEWVHAISNDGSQDASGGNSGQQSGQGVSGLFSWWGLRRLQIRLRPNRPRRR